MGDELGAAHGVRTAVPEGGAAEVAMPGGEAVTAGSAPGVDAAERAPAMPGVPATPEPAAAGRLARLYLGAEFSLLFVAVPLLLYVYRTTFGRLIIPSLLVLAGFCSLVLLADRRFPRRLLWNRQGLGAGLRRMLRTFLPGAVVLTALLALFEPDLLLAFPRLRPGLWLIVMVAYPVLSVYPQELIFRTFIFHRYRAVFPSETARIVASGLAFGLAHLFFANWIAPVLTAVGGILFARTYARTGSTLQVTLEHGLWGDFVFTVGLGWYFYGGSIT